MRLHEGRWLLLGVHRDDDKVHAEPFDAFELELAVLWANLAVPATPGRAREVAASYGNVYDEL